MIKVMISNCGLIFFPINVNGNHWIFVHIDTKNKIITYHDSLKPKVILANKILKNIQTFYSRVLELENKDNTSIGNHLSENGIIFE